MKNSLFLLIVFIDPALSASQNNVQCYEEYCVPSVIGLPRSKGISFEYEIVPEYKIRSASKDIGVTSGSAEVSKNTRIDFKLRVPIINKPSLTIAAGIRFFEEEYYFTETSPVSYPIYTSLQDRSLKTAGLHLYLIKPTRTNKYFLLRVTGDLNGDFTDKGESLMRFLKFSAAPMLGWKKNPDLSFAVGLAYGYTFGRASIYPLFSYNRNFNRQWGIESLLPAHIKIRYSKSEKTFWYAAAELSGASYRLNKNSVGLIGTNNPHLHRSEIRSYILLEKEIHNWLWFGIKGGIRQNLALNLTNSPRLRSDLLIKNKLGTAPLFSASLFMVAPKKWKRN